jgi:hypothetical protein
MLKRNKFMELREWIKFKNKNYEKVAEDLLTSHVAIRNWALKITTPTLDWALIINKYTKGRVKFEDMLSVRLKEKYERITGIQNERNKSKKN